MALRGWRLFGLAGTILVYIGGILFLSFVSLQSPQQKRNHARGYGEFETLRNRDLGLLGKKPPLQWCTELRYMDSPPPSPKAYKLLQTFPGHFVKKFQQIHSFRKDEPFQNPQQQQQQPQRHNDVSSKRAPKRSATVADFHSSSSQWPNSNSNKFDTNKIATSDRIVNDGHQKSSNGRELTALVSFPGSGNTWLRYLLQQSTGKQKNMINLLAILFPNADYIVLGILTGSVYKDYGLLKSGFPAENVANSSVSLPYNTRGVV